TLPMTTVSTSSGLIPARLTAASIATEPRAGAGTSLRLPPKVPIAVRTGSAKTTERDVIVDSSALTAWLCTRAFRQDRGSLAQIIHTRQPQERPPAHGAEPGATCDRRGVDNAESRKRN